MDCAHSLLHWVADWEGRQIVAINGQSTTHVTCQDDLDAFLNRAEHNIKEPVDIEVSEKKCNEVMSDGDGDDDKIIHDLEQERSCQVILEDILGYDGNGDGSDEDEGPPEPDELALAATPKVSDGTCHLMLPCATPTHFAAGD